MDQSLATDEVRVKVPEFLGATIVMLEDEKGARESLMGVALEHGYLPVSAFDKDSVVQYAEKGADFFVLDIRLGTRQRQEEGLDTLEALRRRFKRSVFVAILSVLANDHERALEHWEPDVAQEKVDVRRQMENIIRLYRHWRSGRLAESCELLLPSDSLAVRIAGIEQASLDRLLASRNAVAEAIRGEKLKASDLVQEVGERMRQEVRGILFKLSRQMRMTGQARLLLALKGQLAPRLERLLMRVLPLRSPTDAVLKELSYELEQCARYGMEGEFGRLLLDEEDVYLVRELS